MLFRSIHVQAGTYHEYIKIPTKQKNVMLVGDGKGKTVIVGDRSNGGGWTTFQFATVGKISLSLLLVNYMITITVKGLACVNCIIWTQH